MIGFITGSGFYQLDSITEPSVGVIETPYGAEPITVGWPRGRVHRPARFR